MRSNARRNAIATSTMTLDNGGIDRYCSNNNNKTIDGHRLTMTPRGIGNCPHGPPKMCKFVIKIDI